MDALATVNLATIKREIENALDNYFARPISPILAETIRAHLSNLVKGYYAEGMISYVPKIVSFVESDRIFVDFLNPHTEEPIELDEWVQGRSQ